MKVVISELIWPIGIRLLEQKDYTVVYDQELWKDTERLAFELKTADALIIRNQTKVNQGLLEETDQLKVVGRLGVGLENINLQAADNRDVVVVFAKNANATSVAEYVISAMLLARRSLSEAYQDIKRGNWNRQKFTGDEISGKILGLIGVGEIGHRVAWRANALGLHVMGYDPYVAPFDFPVMESGIELASFDEVLEQADFMSIHVPLTEDTKNIINKRSLTKVKSTACLINSSRGGIVNEYDLAEALQNGAISHAVLDVLEQEPPESLHPLLKLDNCIVTPHIAGLTEDSQIRTSDMVANEVICELEGKTSICRVK